MAFMSPSWRAFPLQSWPAPKRCLRALEEGREGHKPLARIDDLPLFGAEPVPTRRKTMRVEDALRAADPDTLSPKEALELLYDLKRQLETKADAALPLWGG